MGGLGVVGEICLGSGVDASDEDEESMIMTSGDETMVVDVVGGGGRAGVDTGGSG